jgi:BarA-like signal transduction histidine kinase
MQSPQALAAARESGASGSLSTVSLSGIPHAQSVEPMNTAAKIERNKLIDPPVESVCRSSLIASPRRLPKA